MFGDLCSWLMETADVAFENVNGQLFPVIGMREKAAVRVNFGDKPFKWVKDRDAEGNGGAVGEKPHAREYQ